MRVIGAPTELPGCVLWLDAADLSSITKDGSNKVSQWSDKSGNAKHAVQATGADQPTYSAAGFGGFPCIDWGNGEAPARRLVTPNVTYGPFTIFIVATAIVGTTGYPYVHNIYSGGPDSEYFIHGGVAGRPQISLGRGVTVSNRDYDDFSDGRRHIVTRYFGGLNSNNSARLDGLQGPVANRVSNNPGTATATGPMYIGNANLAVAPHRGVTAEFIVFDRMLSEGEMVQVEQYLSRKWKIAPARQIASPLEIDDCAMWFDASQGVTHSGGLVSQWNDSSGNARHIVQASDPLKPTYNAANAAYGGKPTVDWLTALVGTRLDRGSADTLTKPLTVFACCNFSNTSLTQVGLFDNASSTEFTFYRTTAGLWEWFPAGDTLTFPAGPVGTRPFVLSIASMVGENVIRANQATLAKKVASSATGITTFRLGTFVAAAQALNWNGSIAEFLVYRRRLPDGEIAQVEAYLKRKYAL
jgi:hypothetical protein